MIVSLRSIRLERCPVTDSQQESIIYPLCPQTAHPSDTGNFLPISHFRTGDLVAEVFAITMSKLAGPTVTSSCPSREIVSPTNSLLQPHFSQPGWTSGRRPGGQCNFRSTSVIRSSLMLACLVCISPSSLLNAFYCGDNLVFVREAQ